jgi:hypothetical protein
MLPLLAILPNRMLDRMLCRRSASLLSQSKQMMTFAGHDDRLLVSNGVGQ